MPSPGHKTVDMSDEVVPRLYLVICNISKSRNVRQLLLTAQAFGCCSVLVVGQERNLQDGNNLLPFQFKRQMEQQKIELVKFVKFDECIQYLRDRKIFLLGVEIDEQSILLDDDYFHKRPLDKDVAIFMGNEGSGIHPRHMKECQGFVRIPQYGVGTASLNVNVACSIVLYRFDQERQRLIAQSKA